jgi:DNA repair protein RecO (recombination protein O)
MDYGETDRIVTLLTLEHGKLRGVAKGAKKSHKRFGGILEPFARLSAQLTITSGLSRLTGADAVTIFPRIRTDLLKIAYAGYACETADLLLPDGLPNPRLFRLLAAYLEHLDQNPLSPSDRRFYEVNLLNILGYRPAFNQCATCGRDLSDLTIRFAGGQGGLRCGRCGQGGISVSAGTVTLLETALSTGRFGAVRFLPQELAEAASVLDPAIAAHLCRPLKSLAFLAEVGG